MNQKDFADFVGLKRASYTKKELGEVPIYLWEIELLMRKLNIGISDLLIGYDDFYYNPPDNELSKSALEKFPILKNVIIAANSLDEGLVKILMEHFISKQ